MKRAAFDTGRAWVEIDINSLIHNARVLQKALPAGCRMMAVVKANAYGHGDIEVAAALSREGVDAFAVATADEGIRLRWYGIKGEILVLGYTDPQRIPELVRFRLSQTIVDAAYAKELDWAGRPLQVHIKVDTGMHRLGESCEHVGGIAQIFRCGNLKINGIFTHLCSLEGNRPDDIAYSGLQAQRFQSLLDALKARGITLPRAHMMSSYGVLSRYGTGHGYARIGIALYGAASLQSEGRYIDLRPVLALRANVALVRTVPAGESAGYGRLFIAQRETRLAVVTIGYADGVPRSLSCGKGSVLLRGRSAPIVGSVCMDQLTVDVTDIPDVERGDTATLIGRDGPAEITAAQAAMDAGTIPNELLCCLGGRLERAYLYCPAERLGAAEEG